MNCVAESFGVHGADDASALVAPVVPSLLCLHVFVFDIARQPHGQGFWLTPHAKTTVGTG